MIFLPLLGRIVIEVIHIKEINIAKTLISKRKEKGITQDELANYIGVSKASVSKWETGQSYPDVTFLPPLAAYFNISIDELMDYKPQLEKDDIQKLYRRLSADFAAKPFDTVMNDLHQIIKKYYSCFPLLLQMGMLMVNHADLPKDPQKFASIIEEAQALFVRVKGESDDLSLTKQALYMEALCSLALNNPDAALELLSGTVTAALPPESLLASAYQMKGQTAEAKSILQVGIYQNIVVLFNFLPAYLMLCADEPAAFEEVLKRALHVADTFDLKHLHPSVLVALYLCAAQGYVMQGKPAKALDILQQYAEIVTGDIYPLCLHGDSFFNLIEGWLEKLDLQTGLPRDEKTIRKSMVEGIVSNPILSALSGEPRFQMITQALQNDLNRR